VGSVSEPAGACGAGGRTELIEQLSFVAGRRAKYINFACNTADPLVGTSFSDDCGAGGGFLLNAFLIQDLTVYGRREDWEDWED
jgi:hypothetical protein